MLNGINPRVRTRHLAFSCRSPGLIAIDNHFMISRGGSHVADITVANSISGIASEVCVSSLMDMHLNSDILCPKLPAASRAPSSSHPTNGISCVYATTYDYHFA